MKHQGCCTCDIKCNLNDTNEEIVKKILRQALQIAQHEPLHKSTHIYEDLGADSLDVVDILISLEEHFDCEISQTDAHTMITVGDVIRYLDKHKLGSSLC